MRSASSSVGLTRRAAARGSLGLATAMLAAPPGFGASGLSEADRELVRRLTGKIPVASPRVHLIMPPVFGNGYTVPLILQIDSAMTGADCVRVAHVLAPGNPIVLVASFHFTPQSGQARISTRIRLAEPQAVLAAAEMSDGSVLMASTWVKVATNGCA